MSEIDPSRTAPLSVVVVDDHPVTRLGIRATLDAWPAVEVVGEAADGQAALDILRDRQPDVVVLDLLLPDVSGMDVMRTLLSEFPQLKFVAYSQHEDPWFVRQALAAGALGYVFKSSTTSELMRAVTSAASGASHVDSSMDTRLDAHSTPKLPTAQDVRLSQREEQVLRLAAQGVIAKEAAVQLELSHRTFETYKARAMAKLQLRSRADLMRFAEHSGWLEAPGAERDSN